MRWHKFDPNFWDSETADILESNFGEKGILIYLRLISRLALELQTADQVEFIHLNGWTKSLKDWARIAKYSPKVLQNVLETLQKLQKIFMEKKDEFGTLRITLKFKNLHEFVHPEALSSIERKKLRAQSGRPVGGQMAAQDKIREDKIREEDIHTSESASKTPNLEFLWNTHCGSLPKISDFTEKRSKKWISRWKDKPDESYWISVIEKLAASSFCRGESEGGWKATVDFFLRPDTHVKVYEGAYDSRPAGISPTSSRLLQSNIGVGEKLLGIKF